MNRFLCPHCGLQLVDGGRMPGEKVACPKCRLVLVIPQFSITEHQPEWISEQCNQIHTIQATGKTWKLMIVLGSISCAIGATWLALLWAAESQGGFVAPFLLFSGGFAVRMYGKLGKWWYHE